MFKKVKVRVLQDINWFKVWEEFFMLEWNLKYFVWKVEVIEEEILEENKDIKKAENKAILKNKKTKDVEWN